MALETIALTAWNNQTFRLTLDMSAWSGVDSLSGASFSMSVRPADGDTVRLSLSSGSSEQGTITYSASTKRLFLTAPKANMQGLSGTYDYDCKAILSSSDEIGLFGGTLTVTAGVTA